MDAIVEFIWDEKKLLSSKSCLGLFGEGGKSDHLIKKRVLLIKIII